MVEIIYPDGMASSPMERIEPPPIIGPPSEAWYNRAMRVQKAAVAVSIARADEQRAKAARTRATAGKKADKSGNIA